MTTTEHHTTTTEEAEPVHHDGSDSRLWTSRAVLTRMFIVVAVLAVLVVGFVNYLGAREIFDDTIKAQLASLATDRAESVRSELDRAKAEVVVVARDASVAAATREFTETFAELNDDSGTLDPDQAQELDDFYAEGAGASEGTSTSEASSAADLAPQGTSGRYLQYHYIVANPFGPDERQELADADDGSSYSSTHSTYHPMLAERARAMGVTDLLLIGGGPGENVVYSVNKHIDFGTSLLAGPYAGTSVGKAITNRLASVPVGDAILVDFEPYLPDGDLPTMFIAAAIRDQTGIVGSVAVALPRDLLDDVTTFGADWDSVSSGDGGEVYLVGSDLLMRTVSRFWIEDSESYVKAVSTAGYDADVSDRIVRYDSTVLAQPVDTEAVETAVGRGTFLGADTNYLNDKTFAYSEALNMPGLNWVVVSAMSDSEAKSSLWSYVWSLLILALITIPIASIAAFFMARRLTKPVKPLTSVSEAIAGGDVAAQVPDLGRNEYGDLGNRINTISAEIRESDEQRAEREEAISRVLFAALPPRLVDGARTAIEDGTIATSANFGDLTDTCTVIAVSVSGYFDLTASDMESTVDVSSSFARAVERLAADTSVERVRSTPDEYIFTAGLRSPGFATQDAARFILGLEELLEELQEETSRTGAYRIGLSAGGVASGVLRGAELSFGIWGPPVRNALSLVAVAEPYQVLVDSSVADDLGDGWNLQSVEPIDGQDEQLTAFALRQPDGD